MMNASQPYQLMPRRTPPFDLGDVTQLLQPMPFNPGAVPQPYQPLPWHTPPFNPGAAPQGSTYPGGGLLDPIVQFESPVTGGLLDPAGTQGIREEQGQLVGRRVNRKDLPEILRDLPLGPEGGLIGSMLAEYVEPDAEPQLTRKLRSRMANGGQADIPAVTNADLPVPPTKPSPPLPYPQVPLPPSADWADKGFGGPRGNVSTPTINLEPLRRANILYDRPARFDIANSRKADGDEPFHADHDIGREAVAKHTALIEEEARRQGVDPDLVKAVMYVENAQGHYFGLARLAEQFGLADSLFPMNINPKLWSDLAGPGADLSDPESNIRAGVTLIRRIQDRLNQPEVAKIATIYNAGAAEHVNDYGARVADVYQSRLWEQ
jgi:hypothetical protein